MLGTVPSLTFPCPTHYLEYIYYSCPHYYSMHAYFIVIQFLSHVQLLAVPWMMACQAPPLSPRVYSDSCPLSWWCYLTISSSATPFSFCLRSFPASGSFPMSWLSYEVAKVLELISPSSEYSGLVSFRIDHFDLLVVQRTLMSLLQYHTLKESILLCSAFFMVQLSHPHMTTRKTIGLTIQTHVLTPGHSSRISSVVISSKKPSVKATDCEMVSSCSISIRGFSTTHHN